MRTYWRNIVYASPAFAFAIPTFPVMIFLPALYTENFGLSVSKVGIFLFIAKLIDIFSDPIVGWLNDKKIFKRKFLIVLGSIISAVSLCKLFLTDELPFEEYLLLWIGLLYFGWTLFQIPYLSIGYNLESNYFSRTKLSAMRETSILLGLFSSLCLPMLFFIDNVGLVKYLVNIALVTGFLGVCLFCFFIRENSTNNNSFSIEKSYKNILKNIRLKKFLVIWFINSCANVLPMILFAFYITYVLGGVDGDRQKALFFYFLFAIIGVPFWTYLSKKMNKARAWSFSLLTSSFFFIFVIFLTSGDLFLFIIICCLTGFCLGADLVLPPSIQADLTDIHKLQFKEEISGILFSFITLITKLSFALGSIFVFGILGILNFEANSIVSKESSNFIILSYSILPVILKVYAYILLKNFKSSEGELTFIQNKINR